MIIKKEKCKACNLCIEECPHDLLVLSEETNSLGYQHIKIREKEFCTECMRCALICPDLAILFPEDGGDNL